MDHVSENCQCGEEYLNRNVIECENISFKREEMLNMETHKENLFSKTSRIHPASQDVTKRVV